MTEPNGSHTFDGNAEQVRVIAEQLAKSFADKQPRPHHDDTFIAWLEKKVKEQMRLWAFGVIIAYFIPLVFIAYTLGQMSNTFTSAIAKIDEQSLVLASRGNWMAQQEAWQASVQSWMENDPNRPFKPPMYYNGIRQSPGSGNKGG